MAKGGARDGAGRKPDPVKAMRAIQKATHSEVEKFKESILTGRLGAVRLLSTRIPAVMDKQTWLATRCSCGEKGEVSRACADKEAHEAGRFLITTFMKLADAVPMEQSSPGLQIIEEFRIALRRRAVISPNNATQAGGDTEAGAQPDADGHIDASSAIEADYRWSEEREESTGGAASDTRSAPG